MKTNGIFGGARYIKGKKRAAEFSLNDPLPFFRRKFTLESDELGEGRIFVQSPGFTVFYINGEPITEDIFISPLSDYRKILWYNSYDITHLLRKGENVICAIAGNGFFNESFESAWHFPRAEWRDAPQILVCLKINGKEKLVSDGTWKVSHNASHITFSHLRSGEYVDMRKYDPSWLGAGYDDSDWSDVIVRDASEISAQLRSIDETGCPPVRETEVIAPVSVTETKDGYLIDFGVNISGYMEITLQAPRGREMIFRYCEEIDANMRPKHNKMNSDYYYREKLFEFQTDKLISSGGIDTFKPMFSYHGFRYVIIEGLTSAPKKDSVRAYFIHNDVERKADFTSGNEILNYIYNAGIRSTQSNMFWSLTDCPTREKLGWLNDAQATAEQALINFDIIGFYKKWFEDIKADQTCTGELHGIVPTWDWSLDYGPVCDGFLFELPYRIYVYTGDSSMLTEAIPYFDKYIGFLEARVAEDHTFKLGDWTGSDSSERIPKEFVRDIYLLKLLRITALAYSLSGNANAELDEKYSAQTASFKARYLDTDGRCTVDEQTSSAMMIMFGLYNEKQILFDQLARCVERDGIHLTSGMVGIQYLYDALSEIGRADLAYKLITESDPGYRTWYENGATTLWECWDGVDNGSHNHHMFSNVLAWFFKSLLGISPKEDTPGFEEIELKPCFIRDAGFVKGYEDTARGRIEAEWKYENGGFNYAVTIPKGVRAVYDGQVLKTGKNSFFVKEF